MEGQKLFLLFSGIIEESGSSYRDIVDFPCITPGASSRKGQPLIPWLDSHYVEMSRPVINNQHYTGNTAV